MGVGRPPTRTSSSGFDKATDQEHLVEWGHRQPWPKGQEVSEAKE